MAVPILNTFVALLLAGLAFLALTIPGRYEMAMLMTLFGSVAIAAVMFPRTAAIFGVMSLITSPENFKFAADFANQYTPGTGIQTLHKFFLLATLLPALARGCFDLRANPPIFALLIMMAMSLTVSSVYPGLDFNQMMKSFISLALPFLLLNYAFMRGEETFWLRLITILPIISILLGVISEWSGFVNPVGKPIKVVDVEYTGAFRLRGVNFPAFMGFFGFAAVVAGTYMAVLRGQRRYFIGVFIALGCTILSGTRMPSALAIMVVVLAILFVSRGAMRPSAKIAMGLMGGAVLAGILIFYWPNIMARTFNSGAEPDFNTSGRGEVWDVMNQAIDVNPLFGRGIGAGAILLVEEKEAGAIATSAAHNEYLRLLSDAGWVGLILFIVSIIVYVAGNSKLIGRDGLIYLSTVFIAYAIYSYTDNTISAPPAIVLMAAISAIVSDLKRRKIDAQHATAADHRIGGI